MLRTYEDIISFLRKKNHDCFRSKQMPETDKKTKLLHTCGPISELPSKISIRDKTKIDE